MMTRTLAGLIVALGGLALFVEGQAAERPKGLNLTRMKVMSGAEFPPDPPKFQKNVVLRPSPMTVEDHGRVMVFEDLHIRDITDRDAVQAIATRRIKHKGQDVDLCVKGYVFRNIAIENVNRSDLGAAAGLHTDAFQLWGGTGKTQEFPIDVRFEDVLIDGGNSDTLLLQDCDFNTITFQRVEVRNKAFPIKISHKGKGSTALVEVIASPGLRINLQGPPGSIEKIIVRADSPGVKIEGDRVAEEIVRE